MEFWAEEVFKRIEVEVQGKGKFNLYEQLKKGESAEILGRQFPSPPDKSSEKRKLVVIGFEDEKGLWNEHVDLIVKTYTPVDSQTRVEIFCSGVLSKTVWYNGNKVLEYPGYPESDIRSSSEAIPKTGTVIFDV